jgi:hypothetical protein
MSEKTNYTEQELLEKKEETIKEYDNLIAILSKESEYLEVLARKEEAMLRIRLAQSRRIQIEAPAPQQDRDEKPNKSFDETKIKVS